MRLPEVLAPYFASDWDYYWAPRQLVEVAVAHPPLFPPGTSWSYSNTNYILLGLVIKAVTHHDPALEIRRRILVPLGLRDTYFATRPGLVGPHTDGYLTNLPASWGVPGGVLDVTGLSPSWAWTAGAVVSTVGDLARFHRALFTGRLLAPAQQRELQSTVPTAVEGFDYGLGVFRIATACGPAWGHDGDFPGYLTVVLTSPDGRRQAVLSLNTDQVLTATASEAVGSALAAEFCGGQPQASAAAARAGSAGFGLPRFAETG